MNEIKLGGVLPVPQIALGCMRLPGLSLRDGQHLIGTALEEGVNFFDHADIYGGGEAETFFAQAIGMSDRVRERILLQSKCSIRPGICFDFSKQHILQSVDGILRRLQTDYLDVLLLHRPDTLFEPEEVAEAFSLLHEQGKVRHFGVSNQNPGQMLLLQSRCPMPLLANQLQLSIASCGMIDVGLNVNMTNTPSVVHDGGVLEHCRLRNITIQAWSPFQYGFFEGTFLGNIERYAALNQAIDEIGKRHGISNSAVAVAWLSRHPAIIQTVVGTTNPVRLRAICKGQQITLTREEWYALYMAAGKQLP